MDEEVQKMVSGCLHEDDVQRIVGASAEEYSTLLHNLQIFLCNTLLHRKIEHFPIEFILNTGNHSNVGIHWQALHIDHQHTAYFLTGMEKNQVIDHHQKEIKKLHIKIVEY